MENSELREQSIINVETLNAMAKMLQEHIEGKNILNLDKILYLYEEMLKKVFNIVNLSWDKYEMLDDNVKAELEKNPTDKYASESFKIAKETYDNYLKYRDDKETMFKMFYEYTRIKSKQTADEWLENHPDYSWFKNLHFRKHDFTPYKRKP